jgi:glyoxylase-like metal-dependent hydrolase (beta-lactamase superfamily II)
VTIGKTAVWTAAIVAIVTGGLTTGRTGAQAPLPNPQIPQPNFHSNEDTSRFGVKAEDIKAGVLPDFTKLRDQLVVIPVQGNIWLIGGAGANIVMQIQNDGVLLVDSGAEAAADKVIAEVKRYSPRTLRYIINTSANMDNTGGNEKVAKGGAALPAGGNVGGQAFNGAGAPIVAFETVLNRMSAPVGQTAARSTDAWPTDTFFTAKKNMWYNNEAIELWHQPAAHSDGDLMVFFRRSDVIAAGNILSADRFPNIDAERGGSLQGIIDGLNRIVGSAVPQYNQQGGTRIVGGHGRIYNQTDAVEYRDMSTIIRDRVTALAKKGMTLEQVKAAHPTLDYDGQYGQVSSWNTDTFLAEVYKEVTKPAAAPAAAGKKPAAAPAKK